LSLRFAAVIPEQAFDALFKAVLTDRDADAALALWADDADITMWGSDLPEKAVGRAEVHELLKGIAGARTRLSFRWDERRAHTVGNTAWINAAGTIAVNGGAPAAYRLTVVFIYNGDTWQIHTFNGNVPD
jgi:ketosteroid isomerase-like protein